MAAQARFRRSSSAVSSTPTTTAQSVRFSRIEVDSGRINFKRGDEKLPFALVGVTGYVEPAGAGRWVMDLEAIPTRAAVNVQQAGVLHVSGHMGGTSSRLRPARARRFLERRLAAGCAAPRAKLRLRRSRNADSHDECANGRPRRRSGLFSRAPNSGSFTAGTSRFVGTTRLSTYSRSSTGIR